jgi:hypothetical protein
MSIAVVGWDMGDTKARYVNAISMIIKIQEHKNISTPASPVVYAVSKLVQAS